MKDLENKLLPVFKDILTQEKIDANLLPQFKSVYLPLAVHLAEKHSTTPIVIGINGAQGSGKSFLSKVLKKLIQTGFNKSVLHLSIDDLYLSKTNRLHLSKKINPLLRVRGVPGTHDVDLGIKILSSLTRGESPHSQILPVFDKSIDDLLPESQWLAINDPVDIILLEGWCVASIPQEVNDLKVAINDLELTEDQDGIWRNYVNTQLRGPYQKLFGFIDYLVMLEIPDMASVFEWRRLQERKLEDLCQENNTSTSMVMSDSELNRFIMHFERITRSTLAEMPHRADVLLKLNNNHEIYKARIGL